MNAVEKILSVDLTAGNVEVSAFPASAARLLLFGRGFNAWYLSRGKTDPQDPGSDLLLSCGMLAGTGAPASSRLHLTARSPLTGLLGSSNVGGAAAERLAAQGIRTIVVRGRAAVPSVLWIQGGEARLIETPGLWGRDTQETTEALLEKARRKRTSVLAIGPGGENAVRFACIMSGGHHAAGRTGLGAVMGARRLKAIVIEGGIAGPGFRNSEARRAAADYARSIGNAPEFEFLSVHGGAGYLTWAHNAGVMSAFNFRSTRFGGIARMDGRRLTPHVIGRKGCPRCPVRCKADLKMPGLQSPSVRPEFEPLISLGARCGLSDLEKAVSLDNLCSRMGIDNISTGGVLAFAMDLYDRGMLSREECGGVAPVWGDAEAMEEIIRLIVERKGFGDILAQGVRGAAAVLGGDTYLYAAHVKGLELSGYHPGSLPVTALAYAVAGRGGDFNDLYPGLEYALPTEMDSVDGVDRTVRAALPASRTAETVRTAMLVSYCLDCLGLCKVPVLSLGRSWTLENEASLTSAVTGTEVDAGELMAAGERTAVLERILNLRWGLDASDDRLPEMFDMPEYSVPHPGTGTLMQAPPAKEFYLAMGWDSEGRPTAGRLERLGLDKTTTAGG